MKTHARTKTGGAQKRSAKLPLFSWFKSSPQPNTVGYRTQTYMTEVGKAVWSPRDYTQFATEGYSRNVVAFRAVSMVAQAAASVKWKLYSGKGLEIADESTHPLIRLLNKPNPLLTSASMIEQLITYKLISGNAYLLMLRPDGGYPQELYPLRPDRVKVVAGENHLPYAYDYSVGERTIRYRVNGLNGVSPILHLKSFHPLNDWYGLSAIEAAAYSIDQHNQAGEWNKALLQNGAKPSGALMVKREADGSGGTLSDEQFIRLRNQIDSEYASAVNAGRPLLLEGGLEWKEMSLSPRDMDFIECKHSAARDIALAFGVPPQLLGIPGDNTYSNLVEARLAFWEQTVMPLLDQLLLSLNQWLVPAFEAEGEDLTLTYDAEQISALTPRREAVWSRLEKVNFMTINEKRATLGLPAVAGGDTL